MIGPVVLAQKRFGKEQHYVQEFVRPFSYEVRKKAEELDNLSGELELFSANAHFFVQRVVQYPPDPGRLIDWHAMQAFPSKGGVPTRQYETLEYWSFPGETLRDMMGDCDDKSLLLCSLLRTRLEYDQVYCTVGLWNGEEHMWVTLMGISGPMILETMKQDEPTLEAESGSTYRPLLRFNDQYVEVLGPLGALSGLKLR
jgi:hypothetical protein